MNAQTVIGEKTEEGWKPSALLLADWRRRPPLTPQTIFADADGLATPLFRQVWLGSRASALSLTEQIITPEGRPTEYLLKVFR